MRTRDLLSVPHFPTLDVLLFFRHHEITMRRPQCANHRLRLLMVLSASSTSRPHLSRRAQPSSTSTARA
eukprot:scaffold17121_cov122-Isochrysis_galbana.AAC.3